MQRKYLVVFLALVLIALSLSSCEKVITPDPIVGDNNIWHTPEAGTRYVYAGTSKDTVTYQGETGAQESRISKSIVVLDPDTAFQGVSNLMFISTLNGTNFVGISTNGDFVRNINNPADPLWYALPTGSKSTIYGPNVDTMIDNTYLTISRVAEYIGEDTLIIHGKTLNAVHVREIESYNQSSPSSSYDRQSWIDYWYVPELRYFGRMETYRQHNQDGYLWNERLEERLVLSTK